MPSVLTSLEREATERNDAQAHGLAVFVKDSFFVASVYFLSDILPPLAQLSRAFQKTSIDFSIVKPLVQGTKDRIKELSANHGDVFKTLPSVMENLTAYGFQELTDGRMSRFKQYVYHPYLTALAQHLDSRFPDVGLLEAFSIFDPKVMEQQTQPQLLEKLDTILAHYDTHNVLDSDATICEYQCFSKSVLSTAHLKDMSTHHLMSKLMSNAQLLDMFPNFAKIGPIGLVIPMSTADCERGFSALGRIKTDLRNRLSPKALMTISIEGPDDNEFPFERTCAIWSGWRNRRIVL